MDEQRMTDDLLACESPVTTVPFGEATLPEPARRDVSPGPLQLRGSGLPRWMDVRPSSGDGGRADVDRVASVPAIG
jgi:hypothetical protein